MNKKTSFLLILVLGALQSFGQVTEFNTEVNGMIDKYLKQTKYSSLVVATFTESNQKIYTYGSVNDDTPTPPSANSLFPIGNLTEVFTTTLLTDLANEGKVGFDDPIDFHLPSGYFVPNYQHLECHPEEVLFLADSDKEIYKYVEICVPEPDSPKVFISMCNLAGNTSALPWHPYSKSSKNKLKPFQKKTEWIDEMNQDRLFRALEETYLEVAPGERYMPSVFGISVLGYLLAHETGRSLSELMDERVLNKVGMEQTTFSPGDKSQLIPHGHNSKGKNVSTIFDFQALTPAYGLFSSAEDLLKFIRANLMLSGGDLMPDLNETQLPRINIDKKEPGLAAAYGWVVNTRNTKNEKKITLVEKDSQIQGFSAYIGFVRETRTGVVILSASERDVSATGRKILLDLQ